MKELDSVSKIMIGIIVLFLVVIIGIGINMELNSGGEEYLPAVVSSVPGSEEEIPEFEELFTNTNNNSNENVVPKEAESEKTEGKEDLAKTLSFSPIIKEIGFKLSYKAEDVLEGKVEKFLAPMGVTYFSFSPYYIVQDSNLGEVSCYISDYFKRIEVKSDTYPSWGTRGPTYDRYLPVCERILPYLNRAYAVIVDAYGELMKEGVFCQDDDMTCDRSGMGWVKQINF